MSALFSGYVRMRISGGEESRFLNLCANRGIRLWNVRPLSGGYEAKLSGKEFRLLGPLARKCRTHVRITGKYGIPFFLKRNRKRKAFAAGILFCSFFVCFLSCFIWKISIDGNRFVSRETILSWLTEQNAGYGAAKKAIDCKALAEKLRSQFETFTWVSVRLEGTLLSISVQENTAIVQDSGATEEQAPTDLIADCDGTVASIVTRTGTPLVKAGDTVSEGDVLVSGILEITDDAGETVSWQYCNADADVWLKTNLSYQEEIPLVYETKDAAGRKRYGFYIKIFGKYFGLFPGGSDPKEDDVLSLERQLCLFDDFYLPVSGGILRAQKQVRTVHRYTPKEAETLAEAHLQKFLSENEEKGVQIFQNNVRIETDMSVCRAKGTVTVIRKTNRRKTSAKEEAPDGNGS